MAALYGAIDYERLGEKLGEELRGAVRKVHYAPDGCNMAVACTCFLGRVYVHFNNLRTGVSRLYEFDPVTERWEKVRDVGFWDRGRPAYCPPAPHSVALFYTDGYYFDGEKWHKFPTDKFQAPVEVDRENGVAYTVVGKMIRYCDDLDRMLDPNAWKDDVDASKLFPNYYYTGFIMKVGATVFAGAGERAQTPAELAIREAPGSWTVKSYKDIYRPLHPVTAGIASSVPVGSSFPNTRTFRLGGVEEVGLINAFDGCIYFLTADGKLKRVLEPVRQPPPKTFDERYYRAPTYYGYGVWAGWGCLVGSLAVFHSPGGGTGAGTTGLGIWVFDGMQFYRVAVLPAGARGMTYCAGRLFVACQPHGGEDVPGSLAWSSHDRAYLAELELDVLERRELPPRTLRVWNNYLIGTDGLYSDEEYFDGTYYYPATEILSLGYDKKAIYLVSDQDGTLEIEIDPDLRGNWKTFDSVSVTANTLVTYMTTHPFARMRFKFTPVATARVSAWVIMEGGSY